MTKKITISYKAQLTAILCIVMSAPGIGYAASFDYGGKAGLEHFKWEEFDPNDGSKLLTESGTREMVSGFIGNTLKANRHFIYRGEAKLYFGTVNYDGGTQEYRNQPSVSVQSDTTYSGIKVEGEAGFRTGEVDSSFAWDFVGRYGVDSWVREIAASRASDGTPTGKAQEEYTILNLSVGTGPNWRSGNWQGRLIAGLKYPFYTYEYVSKDYTNYDRDVTLEPKGQISPFLNFNNNILLTNRLWLTIEAFYDSYRFNQSDSVIVLDYYDGFYKSVVQPKSQQDNYGVQIGVSVSL